jgi:uncharacterized membrane protein
MHDNIHPLLVHFPIAFLGLYAILEIFRFKILTRQTWWFYVKAVLVIAGAASGGPTILAGLYIKAQLQGGNLDPLILVHETFAICTIALAGLIALSYLAAWINRDFAPKSPSAFWQGELWRAVSAAQRCLIGGSQAAVLALFILAGISITGALGGVIVYGPNFEPFAAFVYRLFFP